MDGGDGKDVRASGTAAWGGMGVGAARVGSGTGGGTRPRRPRSWRASRQGCRGAFMLLDYPFLCDEASRNLQSGGRIEKAE
jgi:hypothetical protein